MVMGDIAVPTSQQHMTAGFMFLTMEDVVPASFAKCFFVDARLSRLDVFQSMLTKIMFAPAVLCSSGPVPRSVAADNVEGNHADDIAEAETRKQQLFELLKSLCLFCEDRIEN